MDPPSGPPKTLSQPSLLETFEQALRTHIPTAPAPGGQ